MIFIVIDEEEELDPIDVYCCTASGPYEQYIDPPELLWDEEDGDEFD